MLAVLRCAAILVALVVGTCTVWSGEPEVLARVNGEPVTRADLHRVLADSAMRVRLLQELGSQNPETNELERLALQKLITRGLLLQEAARRNLTVSEQELDQAFTRFRSRFKNARKFAAWKKARELDDTALREDLRAQILLKRVRAALAEEVRLSEEEVQAYYEGNREHWKTKSLAEVRPEIERRLLPKKREEAIQAWLAEREKQARIEVFVALAPRPDLVHQGVPQDQEDN